MCKKDRGLGVELELGMMGKRIGGACYLKVFLDLQESGRGEVQGQAHDAKVALGGCWASLPISWPTCVSS